VINRSLQILLTFLLCCASLTVLAQRKTDVVTLYNGDKVTGEIKALNSGILELSTDSMGTLKIEWQEIATIQSEYYYEVRLGNGRRYYGSIEPAQRPGQLLVGDLDGVHDLAWLEVVDMRPIEKRFLDRLDIYFSAGYSYSRASSVAQTSINTNIGYEDEKSRSELSGRTSITDDSAETTSSSRVDLDRAVWTRWPSIFRSSFANYETNDELELDYRFGIGAGVGRTFVDNYKNRFSGIAGLQVITEQSNVDGSDQNIELYLSSRYAAWRFNTPELDLNFILNVYPSLTESGRLRSDSNLILRWELLEDLFLDITAYGTYDNRANANSGLDYGVTTGVGWKY
jgi:hypothetical protein